MHAFRLRNGYSLQGIAPETKGFYSGHRAGKTRALKPVQRRNLGLFDDHRRGLGDPSPLTVAAAGSFGSAGSRE